jgi:hypothetical protein
MVLIKVNSPVARSAYGGVIIALAVALGYALAAIPNIELISLTLAFGGYLLGAGWGAVVGALGFGLYSAISPFGIAPPPVFIAQIIGGSVVGLSGALLRNLFASNKKQIVKIIFCGLAGFCATLIYDILTNLGAFAAISSQATFIPFMIGGIAFAIVHIISNTAIFALLLPILAGRIK